MFTGLFRRRENDLGLAAISPLEAQRQRQIESLKKHNPSLVELHRNEEYCLSINTTHGILVLNIRLPSLFPQVKPVIAVSQPIRHPWVNDLQQVVDAPELLNFSMHSDLGKIVSNITEEFQRHPPPPPALSFQQSRLPSQLMYPLSPPNGIPPHNPLLNLPNAVYTPGSGKSVLHLPFPQGAGFQCDVTLLPTSLMDLRDLGVTELQELNEDTDRLQEYIEKLDIMQKIAKEKDDLSDVNEALANGNVMKQPVLEARKNKLLETMDTVSNLRQQFDDCSHEQQILSEKYSPTAIQQQLKVAAVQAEEDSERIAESFLDGKMEIEEFLNKFMDRRILSHCRRAKEEKLHQQLMELKKSGF